jgi:hypothetical protein
MADMREKFNDEFGYINDFGYKVLDAFNELEKKKAKEKGFFPSLWYLFKGGCRVYVYDDWLLAWSTFHEYNIFRIAGITLSIVTILVLVLIFVFDLPLKLQ